MPNCSAVKKYRKLVIIDNDTGKLVYHPPNFLLPVTSRSDYDPLVHSYNVNGFIEIDVLIEFESRFNPRRKMRHW